MINLLTTNQKHDVQRKITSNQAACKRKSIGQKERDEIYDLSQLGCIKGDIADILHRDPSTIGREIKRNETSIERRLNNSPKKKKHYLPDRAQKKYEERRRNAKTSYPLKNPFIYTYTHEHLKIGWSPEIISGRLKKEHSLKISPECIYQYIYSKKAGKKGFRLWEYLLFGHKKGRKKTGRKSRRVHIPNRIDISQRPPAVDARGRMGDWEGDTIFGKGNGPALGTFNGRKGRVIRIRKLKRKTADEMKKAAVQVFIREPEDLRLTMTLDNGSENTGHEKISEKTGLKIYFARPYHSWERGSNERGNGLIRRYFPKKTDFAKVSEAQIRFVEEQINSRPMKCLGWKTPNEVYKENIAQILSSRTKKLHLKIGSGDFLLD